MSSRAKSRDLAFGFSVALWWVLSWICSGFFLKFPQNIAILHSFVTTRGDFALERRIALRHIAYTQARSSLKRLLEHRKDARSFRRFPRVNCWRVSRNAVTRAGLPGRCGLLRVSACKGGTGLLAPTMTADREIRRWRAGTRALRSAVNAEGAPHAAPAAVAGRGHFALQTARVAGPGRIILGLSSQFFLHHLSSRAERSELEGPCVSLNHENLINSELLYRYLLLFAFYLPYTFTCGTGPSGAAFMSTRLARRK